jgi:hypothetical protein
LSRKSIEISLDSYSIFAAVKYHVKSIRVEMSGF